MNLVILNGILGKDYRYQIVSLVSQMRNLTSERLIGKLIGYQEQILDLDTGLLTFKIQLL